MPSSRPLWALLLLQGAAADRTTNLFKLDVLRSAREEASGLAGAGVSRQLLSRAFREQVIGEPLMCGDTQIRQILKIEALQGASFDIELVKNIRFEDAFASADRYVMKQQAEESRLAGELKLLESRWYEASLQATAGRPDAPDAAITEALRKSLADSYGDLRVAVANDCSALPAQPGAVDPYDASRAAFAAAVQAALGRGKFNVLVRPKVKELCVNVLGLTPETDTKTCDGLCDALAAKAESISEELSVQAPSNGELREQIQQKTAAIEGVKAAIKDCESTREGIRSWSSQIKEISAQHDSHGRSQREIRSRLSEVVKSLELYKQSVTSQTQLLGDLMRLMSSTKAKERGTKTDIEANKHTMQQLQAETTETKAALDELREELTKSQSAVKAMQAFKAGLVLTMQSFVQIYDDAVRKPLRDAGITKAISTATDEMFPNLEQAKTWAQPAANVEALERECGEVARASVAACDISPVGSSNATLKTEEQVGALCGAGRALQKTCAAELRGSDYVAGVRSAVEAKQAEVRRWIDGLRAELEDLSDARGAAGREGEPEWLRRYASVLPGTQFYQDFVAKWALPEAGSAEGTGILYNMVKVLAGVESQLMEKQQYATDKLKRLNDQYVGSVALDARLRAKLTEVESELNQEDSRKIALSTKLEEFEQGMQSKEEQRARLQKQLDALAVNFRALEGNLKDVFQEFRASGEERFRGAGGGDALLQTLRQMHVHSG